MQQREWFIGVWERANTFALPVSCKPLFMPTESS
jgi:hypothetical protein